MEYSLNPLFHTFDTNHCEAIQAANAVTDNLTAFFKRAITPNK